MSVVAAYVHAYVHAWVRVHETPPPKKKRGNAPFLECVLQGFSPSIGLATFAVSGVDAAGALSASNEMMSLYCGGEGLPEGHPACAAPPKLPLK